MAIACKKAALATAGGGDPVQIAHAALMPYKEKTLSNLRKLRAQ
jgi:hypothetical protein